MRVLVCGGRDYPNHGFVYQSLYQLRLQPLFDLIIQGGAMGADRSAKMWAADNDIPCLNIPAPWSQKGKSAGIIRNLRMLEWRPDLVVAFPGGNGTAHMIRIAQEARVELWQPQLHAELPSRLIDLLRIHQGTTSQGRSSHPLSAESNGG